VLESKSPASFEEAGLLFWRRPTLAQPFVALPSGLQRLTSVFGMGTGGATALRSPEAEAESSAPISSDLIIYSKELRFSDVYIQEVISNSLGFVLFLSHSSLLAAALV
jgi:hypothetical protein